MIADAGVPLPVPPGEGSVDPASLVPPLLNRERAILEFNRRVLAQARREDVPLLERLRYVCIVSSNMDEFFEVRLPITSRQHASPARRCPRASSTPSPPMPMR